ncbi:glycosyltransferase [Meiothermus taiwanensis]|jgi:teichuronic acid biosynthesis glycosyltransferase TuaC|uniref:Glycosyl transferase group 1 n=1 Tax=Meiothermus taiwanensis WR-220 TaxID=1339250 RepID=A0ABN5M0D8_9DEIN|nr:glycosyltransferase [Meiothermus taiwanensis]AWR87723.1 glycosyl transferase group 1 [Meiothermus taiwanensis WR-220]KIQ54602.1 group 1 glycosyl transferase [Meiothermus taiwanensis]KZK15222.1 group 1 glycosyl transferase [Meiothermus taiwanensis]
MRVLFLSPDFPSNVHPSACIFVQTQALELQRLGVQVDVHAPIPLVLPGMARLKPNWRAYAQIPNRYDVEGVRVLRPRYLAFPNENLWGWPHRLKVFSLPAHPCDLIHAHFAHPEGTLGLLLKRRWKKPLVVTLHGDDANTYPEQSPRYRKYYERVLAQADLILAVSDGIRQKAQARTQRPVLTHRVGLRLPPIQENPDKTALRSQLGLPQDRFVLLFVGTLVQYKGVLELSEALRQLDDEGVLAVFIGDGPLRDGLGGTSRTQRILLGQQPNAVVRRYMAAADALILPSYREGLPTVVVEAGAVGLPVIASNRGGTPEIVTPETGYRLEEISPAAILAAIAQVRSNPLEAQARGERLRQHVYHYYDASRNAQALVQLYRQLLEGALS